MTNSLQRKIRSLGFERIVSLGQWSACLMLIFTSLALADPSEDFRKGVGACGANNYTEAATFFRRAAEQGLADAQFFLGAMYSEVLEVAKNDKQAVAWYQRAAEQGHADAQKNLSVMYGLGQGVPQNPRLAYQWALLAAVQGAEGAQGLMYLIRENTSPEERQKAQDDAKAWLIQFEERQSQK